MTAFGRRTCPRVPVDFPPELWQLFSQSSLTALGKRFVRFCASMTWRGLISPQEPHMRQWRSLLEKVYQEVRQRGVGIPGGVESVGLRARPLHEKEQLVRCRRPLQCLQRREKGGGACEAEPRPADVVFQMDSGEVGTIACSKDVQQGHPMGLALFCLALRLGADAVQRGIRGRRSGSVHVHGRCRSRSYRGHG